MAIYDEEAERYERFGNIVIMGVSLLIIAVTFVGVVSDGAQKPMT